MTDEARSLRLLEGLSKDVTIVRETVAELRGQVATALEVRRDLMATALEVRRDLATHEASDARIHSRLETSTQRTTWLAGVTLLAILGTAVALLIRIASGGAA